MTRWTQPPISPAAEAALAALEQPSAPTPLPGSLDLGYGRYHSDLPHDAIVAAYQRDGAPLPAAAKLRVEREALIVEAPFRTSIVTAGRLSGGDYRITGRPTLDVAGAGPVPSFTTYTRVGSCLGFEGTWSIIAEATVDGKPWLLFVGPVYDEESDDRADSSEPPPVTPPRGYLIQMSGKEAAAAGDAIRKKVKLVPATLTGPDPDGAFAASLDSSDGAISISGVVTDTIPDVTLALGMRPAG